ncbi:MAG: Rrf2 family transcriptional regulator [Spirochaetales bacterium]|jgi:Rrf2 family protein|nr:Rrf2 family transcriptional regulator [Spirochaetales bacterium]MBQ4281379.1 Rrf2 family transcriptional regulator [Spirochaetales bacterium]MBQ7282367.1 Rrf2 family transcriptional regulator [Spirochaetales bacterium]
MRISTKGRYAMCVMIDLAEHYKEGPVALKDIAARQNISKKYLEQIVSLLNRPDFLKTIRGAQGGYMLARTPDKYTVAEILKLSEGSLAPVPDLDDPSEAAAAADYQLLPLWQGLYDVVNNYLEGVTLQSILDKRMESFDYSI